MKTVKKQSGRRGRGRGRGAGERESLD